MQNLLAVLVVITLLAPPCAHAFSLLGPYTDWMTPQLSYRLPREIGGPMQIDEEYRWNVPLVTYAFDQSFLDYFGSNGVAAVEAAIEMLNALPPTSSIVLSNYPLYSIRQDYRAGSQSLMDLKSKTLVVLLQQVGLAPPLRNMFRLRKWDPILLTPLFTTWYNYDEQQWPSGTVPDIILKRNYDPETLMATNVHNGLRFAADAVSRLWHPLTGVPAFAL